MTQRQIEDAIAAQLPGRKVVAATGGGVESVTSDAVYNLTAGGFADVGTRMGAPSPALSDVKRKYAQLLNAPATDAGGTTLGVGFSGTGALSDGESVNAEGDEGDILIVLNATTDAGGQPEKSVIMSSKTGKVVGFQG